MKPTQFRLRPQLLPTLPQTLTQLLSYPTLQHRINSQQLQLSGIHSLIVQLKKQTIEQLKQEFINNNNSVNLHQFMWLISNSVIAKGIGQGLGIRELAVEDLYYRYEIQYEIVKVFEEIDIDGSNSISWEEYIEFFTSSSLMEINQDNDKELAALLAQDKKTKQLQFSHREKTLFRKNAIRQIVEIDRLGMLALVQKKSDCLTFLASNGGLLPKPFTLHGVEHSKVLSIDYSEDDRMFGVLMNTHAVIFVEDTEIPKVQVDNVFSGNQVEIVYLRNHKAWLLLSLDNTIQIFSLSKSRKKEQENDRAIIRFKPHSEQLIGVRELVNPLSLVSAGWGGSIKIWSLTLNQLLIDLNPIKEDDFSDCKSIKGFEVFNAGLVSYIICWMFSTEISVWLPSSSLTKPYLGKLKGHVGIVQQAKFLPNFPIVVSIDNKSSVRVWDIGKMQCIQSWKMESITHPKITILRSMPYVLFYDKLIEFYKSTKEISFRDFNTQKRSPSMIALSTPVGPPKEKEKQKQKQKEKQKEKQGKLKKQKKSVIVQPEPQKKKQRQSILTPKQQQDPEFSFETKQDQKTNTVLAVLYDNYFGCFIVLMPEVVTLIAINTGNLMHKAYIENKGDTFVAICRKENRRFFVASTAGEVICFKTEDCEVLYKIYPFKDLLVGNMRESPEKHTPYSNPHPNPNSYPHPHSSKHPKPSSKPKIPPSSYTILALDYNPYNKVLLIIAQADTHSIVLTYDNFSFQPVKKKEVISDQLNLCSFASAKKFNLFYVGSNCPEVVSIWDYHNFGVLRTIQLGGAIMQIRAESDRHCLLLVIEKTGIRIMRVMPIDARNNNRTPDSNLISTSLYIKNLRKTEKAELILHHNDPAKLAQRKNKVTFDDEENGNGNGNGRVKQEDPPVQAGEKVNGCEIYAVADGSIVSMSLTEIVREFGLCAEPLHAEKSNITRELKKISISPQPIPAPNIVIEGSAMKSTIAGSKKNVAFLGRVNELLYFQSIEGILNFYKPEELKIWGKLSLPKCEVIEWRVFYDLAHKIMARLAKAQKVSKQIYAYKRREKDDEAKIQYLRIAFLLNKYFTESDMKDLIEYLSGVEKNRKAAKSNEKQVNNLVAGLNKKEEPLESKPEYFDHNILERAQNRNQTAEKMRIIEKKYSKVFAYIKNKQEGVGQEGQRSKLRSASVTKLSMGQKKHGTSSSLFKIKNTVSSANKMFFQHTKEIKGYLDKIGVINSKMKGLKL